MKLMESLAQTQPTDITAAVPAAPHKIGMSELLLDLKATAPQDYQALSNFIHSMDDVLKPEVVGEVFKESTAKALLTAKLALASVESGLEESKIEFDDQHPLRQMKSISNYLENFSKSVELMGGTENYYNNMKSSGVVFDEDKINKINSFLEKLETMPQVSKIVLQNLLSPEALNAALILKEISALSRESTNIVPSLDIPQTHVSDVKDVLRISEMPQISYSR
jgi:hypothetical protein